MSEERTPAFGSDAPPAHPETSAPVNPWSVTMISLAGLLLVVGLALLLNEPTSSFRSDPGLSTSQLIGAGMLGWAATLAVAWLACKALTWAPASR